MDMGKNEMKKCNTPGCGKWVVDGNHSGYCPEHQGKLDPISALYVDKTPEQLEADERTIEFFSYLLRNKTFEELMG